MRDLRAARKPTSGRAAPSVPFSGTLHATTWAVLESAWSAPLSLEGNYTRSNRFEVALLASLGYLSIIAPDGETFDRAWHITVPGLQALTHHNKEQSRNG